MKIDQHLFKLFTCLSFIGFSYYEHECFQSLSFLEFDGGLEANDFWVCRVLDVSGDLDLSTQKRFDQIRNLSDQALNSIS